LKKIKKADYLLRCLEIDNILPTRIYKTSKEKYFDSFTNYNIAIGKAQYKGKIREIATVYEETVGEVRIITIYPLKTYEKISKIESGRWQKI